MRLESEHVQLVCAQSEHKYIYLSETDREEKPPKGKNTSETPLEFPSTLKERRRTVWTQVMVCWRKSSQRRLSQGWRRGALKARLAFGESEKKKKNGAAFTAPFSGSRRKLLSLINQEVVHLKLFHTSSFCFCSKEIHCI